ncbi:MAG: hypothetical protein M3Y24_08930 [Acidobacteriota bacterium]|nr:hypothetical protein [Acidobacteriota bacterium]
MRVFLACSAVCLVSVLSGCGKHSASGVSIHRDLRKLVSPDTTALAGCDLDRLKVTDFYKRHQAQLNIPLIDGVAQQSGFDPRRNLTELLVTWNGKDLFFATRGNFKQQQIENQLAKSSKPVPFEGHTLFTDSKGAFAFLDDHVAIAGQRSSVENVIEGQSRDEMPDELAHRLAGMSEGNQIWMVSRGSLPFADMHMRSDYASILANFVGFIKGTSTGIEAGSGIHLKSEIDCVSDEGAKRVNDALRGGIGLARLSTKDDQLDMLKAYDAIHVTKDNQAVYVDANLSADLVDKLLGHVVSFDFSGRFQPNH